MVVVFSFVFDSNVNFSPCCEFLIVFKIDMHFVNACFVLYANALTVQ